MTITSFMKKMKEFVPCLIGKFSPDWIDPDKRMGAPDFWVSDGTRELVTTVV